MQRHSLTNRPAHRRPWSPEDDHVLATMIAAGELIGPIAAILGRTQEAIRNRANMLGLPVQSSPGRGRRRLDS